MNIVLASSCMPFVRGGGRFIVDWLEEKLIEYGHQVEKLYLPFEDRPDKLLEQISAFRLMDLSQAGDLLIAIRPPAHVLRHPRKVLWFIHHIRAFYDLWGEPFAPPPTPANDAVRRALVALDNLAFAEAEAVFTNSQRVSERLTAFNGVASKPLYPPLLHPERFVCRGYGDEILAVNRVEPHKRQLLLVEAMAQVKSDVRLRICGKAFDAQYAEAIQRRIEDLGLSDRVRFEDRWIDEAEKADLVADALALAYTPMDEDGIGYPCEEAAHAAKAIITTTDAGAVLEFVSDGYNGLVAEPDPAAIAEAMDRLRADSTAQRLGANNQARLAELAIDWSPVISALTASRP